MSEPFLAEVKLVGFTFAPRGWALCDGQLLPINQNQSLYSLLGTTYGGDGRTSFALPELRGRVPVHPDGNAIRQGSRSGEENHTLIVTEIPAHTHQEMASSDTADQALPNTPGEPGTGANARVLAKSQATAPFWTGAANLADMNASTVENAGGNLAHPNMQPYLALNFCIALQGLFPSRN